MTNFEDTLKYLKQISNNFEPEIAIILGSGLGEFADETNGIKIPYSDIPHFACSTIPGHKGQLVFATVDGKKVVMMQGRFHYYEGNSIKQLVYPIAVFKKLGVSKIILTNAAGSLNKNFDNGDLMLISDHINLMGTNPLIGPNDSDLGERFPDMSDVYSKELRDVVKTCAKNENIKLQEGVYAAMSGPSYETPAEVRMLQILGADAVGMSTVPEAIFANYAGIKVVGISCLTNPAAGLSNQKLTHSEVVETANITKNNFKKLLSTVIKNI